MKLVDVLNDFPFTFSQEATVKVIALSFIFSILLMLLIYFLSNLLGPWKEGD